MQLTVLFGCVLFFAASDAFQVKSKSDQEIANTLRMATLARTIEEQPTLQDEISSKSGILHRLGAFLGGLTSRCRRRVKRVRNHRKQRTSVSQKPGNSGEENSGDENRSSAICPGKQSSDEDGNIPIEEKVENGHNIVTCHHTEPKHTESTLLLTEGNVTPQYQHGQREENVRSTENVPMSENTGKDKRSTNANHSISPLLGDTQTSSELHQVLPKEENSKQSPRKLSSRISNTVHVYKSASTSTTRVKNQTSNYSSSQSRGIQELSRNVLGSLLTANGNVTNDSYRWLVDSRKKTVTPFGEYGHPHSHDIGRIIQPKTVIHRDNSPTRGSSIPLTLPNHTQLIDSNKSESALHISAWNRLPLRHKRTLNFSRNYVQHGNDDLEEIGVELMSTVKEWCSQHDRSSIESNVTIDNLPLQNDTLDDSNKENFQPLLKLGIIDKPDKPQSRNTKSHNILESVNTLKLDKNDFVTGELTTVEQYSNVGPVVSPQKVLSDNLKVEEFSNPEDYSPVLISQKKPVSRNRQQSVASNGQHSETTHKQIETANTQQSEVTKRHQQEVTNSLLVAAKAQHIKAINCEQSKATHTPQKETTNRHARETKNGKLQEATHIRGESANNQQSETTKGQQSETTLKEIETANNQQLEITNGRQPNTTNRQEVTTKPQQIKTAKATHTKQIETTRYQQEDDTRSQQQETADEYKLETTKIQQPDATKGHQQRETNNQISGEIYKGLQTGTNEKPNQAGGQQLQITGRQTLEATHGQIIETTNGQQPGQANNQLSQEISRKEDLIETRTMKNPAMDEEKPSQTSNSVRGPGNHREMEQLDNIGYQTNGEAYTYKNEMHKYGNKKENHLKNDGDSSDMDSNHMREYKVLSNTTLTKASDARDMALRSVEECSAAINVTCITNEYSSKTLIPDDKVSKSKGIVVEQQCGKITVDSEVIHVQSSERHTNDQINNATDICENYLNQNTERKTLIMERETNTRDKFSSMESNSQSYQPQKAMVKSVVNQKNEQSPVKISKEHTMTGITSAKRQNENSSPTERPMKLLISSNNIHDRREAARELSFKLRDEKDDDLNINDSRPKASPITKQTSQIKDTVIPADSSTGDASTCRTKPGIYSTAKRVVINKSFFRKRKINETTADMLKNDKTAATHSAELTSDKTDVMSFKDQSKQMVEDTNKRCEGYHSVLQNPWMMTFNTINRGNQSGEQKCTNVKLETSSNNKEENNVETPNQIDPAKPASVYRKDDSSKGESDQTNRETIEPDSKRGAVTSAKPSDRETNEEVLLTVSIGNSELSEFSTEETVCPSAVIPDKPFGESRQLQVQPMQEQAIHDAQMKHLLDSIHDQTTIESDFSDDVSGDYCNHSEMTQDVHIIKTLHVSSRTDSPVTQRKDNPPEEKVTLLNKRDRLMKPLMKNIINASKESSTKAVNADNVDGKIQSESCTLRKGEQHSGSMPNIQRTTVHNDNEDRPCVVIKYNRQPYPPEGRPLSASMGSFRFHKIQGVSGELEKAQSSNDIREDGNVVKETGYDTDKDNGDQENWTSIHRADVSTTTGLESPKGNHVDAYSKSGINQKSVSNPKRVSKPASKVAVVVAKKIMNKRKTAAPPLLRFDSYKADDDIQIPSVIASYKRSPEVEGLTNDTQPFGHPNGQTEQPYAEADIYRQKDINSGINTVGFSPRELAFAQKLSHGERKTMTPSNIEKVSYPDLVSSNTTQDHSDSRVSNSLGTPIKYSENQRKKALRKSLSGSAASDDFLEMAMSERRVVLPSRFQGRKQKVASSSPTRQASQYGSSSDPRRRQQLENKLHGSTDRNRNMFPFSKSTDSPRVIQASKKIMVKRGTLHSSQIINRNADVADSSGERPDDERVAHSGHPMYPLIGGRTSGATSVDHEHDSLLLNDQDTERDYYEMGKSSELLDSDGMSCGFRQDLSHLQNILDENESTKNMSGSTTSSTFLNTAISERRAIFPCRLRSKANNSTTGIGPPVLASKRSTTGLRYVRDSSETSLQDGNNSVIPTESFEKNTGDDHSGINMASERTEVNMMADSSQGNMTDGNEDRPDSSHLQQTKRDVNSVTSEYAVQHFESNKSPEEKIKAVANRNVQLPVPKPRETLVPSNFPVNKHRLPTVYNPLRETVAATIKAPTTPRLTTTTPLVTAVREDSVEGNEIVKPIIRKPPMESIPAVSRKIKNFRSRQKMVLTGRLHQKSEENLNFFKQISKTTADFYKDRTRNVQ